MPPPPRFGRAMGAHGSAKVAYDLKQQSCSLLLRGCAVRGQLLDPMIAAWMLSTSESESPSLEQLGAQNVPELFRALPHGGSARDLCCRQALLTYATMAPLERQLEERELLPAFLKQVINTIDVINAMKIRCDQGNEDWM